MNLPWTTELTRGGAEVRTRVWWSLETKFLILGGAPLPSLPPKCSLWGWHSVGLRTCAAIGFPRCLPVCIPPCKLFAPPPLFCKRGLQSHVGLFSQFQGSNIPVGAIHCSCTWKRHEQPFCVWSISDLAGWMAEPWRRGEEQALVGSARTAKPCSVYSGAAGVRMAPASWCVSPLLPPCLPGGQKPWVRGFRRAGRTLHLWEVEAELGLGPWVSHLELRPGSLHTQAPAMPSIERRGCLVLWEVWESGNTRAPPYLSMARASASRGHCLSAASCKGNCRPAPSCRFEPVMLITVVPFTEDLGARHFASAKMYINVNFLHTSSQDIQHSVKYKWSLFQVCSVA